MFKLRCDHIHLKSNDVEATAQWYCTHLGAEITFKGSFRGAKVYYLAMGGMNFILSSPSGKTPCRLPSTPASGWTISGLKWIMWMK